MLDEKTRLVLLAAACQSIKQGISGGWYEHESSKRNSMLDERRASFVTLKRHGVLRGCIGTLDPSRSLIVDVVHNAKAAAHDDPRFPALTAAELEDLHVEISVLTTHEPIDAKNRAELLQSLIPHEDGLIVREGVRRATFLPSVWSTLSEPVVFYEALMQKAGLGSRYWSPSLRFSRYRTESFGRKFVRVKAQESES